MEGLSKTSKMPGPSWGLDARRCPTGSKLARTRGTVCSECYALRGRYHMPQVKRAQQHRWEEYQRDPGRWVDRMIDRIEPYRWFRWFDSGDLQSADMLRHIFYVCEQQRETHHYLPTKEIEFVREAVRHTEVPPNLCIRISAYSFDRYPPKGWSTIGPGVNGSTATSKGHDPLGQRCPAPDQGNKCGDCRACWDRDVPLVSYDRKTRYIRGKG